LHASGVRTTGVQCDLVPGLTGVGQHIYVQVVEVGLQVEGPAGGLAQEVSNLDGDAARGHFCSGRDRRRQLIRLGLGIHRTGPVRGVVVDVDGSDVELVLLTGELVTQGEALYAPGDIDVGVLVFRWLFRSR